MALLFIDGFENTLSHWYLTGYGANQQTGAAYRRSGFRGGWLTPSTGNAAIHLAYPNGSYPARVTFGVAHRGRVNANGYGHAGVFALLSLTGGRLITLYQTAFGLLQCVAENPNRTLFYTSKTWTRYGNWHYIEMDYSADGVELRVNGQTEGVYAGTLGSPVGYFMGGGDFYADDLYIADDGIFRGDCAVDMLYPAGATAQTDFTAFPAAPNYLRVAETPTDDDTTYVQSATPGAKDLYTFSPTEFDGSIFGVQVIYNARKSTAGPRAVRSLLKSGGITEPGATSYPSYPSWQYRWDPWTNKPGGGSWTYADVNALEAGAEVVT